jgi:hypothetical protein
MGIKGTVKRSSDTNFIHTNIDIDLIISEEPDEGIADKPEEIFHIIEHFCLGKRRLYLFGRNNTIRQGWLTIGPDISETNFNRDVFKSLFDLNQNANLTGSTERIEMLRPKTPPPKVNKQQQIQQQQQQQQQPPQQMTSIALENSPTPTTATTTASTSTSSTTTTPTSIIPSFITTNNSGSNNISIISGSNDAQN